MRDSDVPASLSELECPDFGPTPWVTPSEPLRVAVVSTAGLMHRGDEPFSFNAAGYRIIDREREEDLVMSHISTNFDRTGFAQDHNVVLPLDRLEEMAQQGQIGSLARYHYSFMGATPPEAMESTARALAQVLVQDQVNTVLLVPI